LQAANSLGHIARGKARIQHVGAKGKIPHWDRIQSRLLLPATLAQLASKLKQRLMGGRPLPTRFQADLQFAPAAATGKTQDMCRDHHEAPLSDEPMLASLKHEK